MNLPLDNPELHHNQLTLLQDPVETTIMLVNSLKINLHINQLNNILIKSML